MKKTTVTDGKNRVATRKAPLLRQESFQYDGKDNLTQSIDRKGQVTTTTYDSRNRPTVVTYASCGELSSSSALKAIAQPEKEV